MAILHAAFPAFYRNVTPEDAKIAVNLWAEMFADDPAEQVAAAVKALIATQVEGYPPTIGAVKEKLRELRYPDAMTAQDAWAIVVKAATGNLKWDKIPENIQKAIGSATILNEWRMMDEEAFHSVVYSNFIKAYKIIEEREATALKLPSAIRNAVSGYFPERRNE